jgi:hypothetical protein
VYQNSSERNRPVDLIEDDADDFIKGIQNETARGYAAEEERERTLQDIAEQEDQIEKAISPNRTEEENAALRRKQAEITKLRERASEPRSLIDESELNRHERRILRFVMNVVYKLCGPELAKQVADEINKKLREKARKEGKGATQSNGGNKAKEAAVPAD